MDVFPILLIGFFFMMVVFGVTWAARQDAKKNMLEALDRLGLRGRAEESYLTGPAVRFEVDGVPSILEYQSGGKHQSAFTRIRFDSRPAGNLRITPHGFWADLPKLFGA